MTTDILNIKAYDFDLPENLIAQYPANPPDSCKLLICKLKGDKLLLKDEIFKNIINYLKGNEVLFFNNTKVIKARLLFNLIKKEDKTFFVKISDNLQEAKFEILFLNQKDENIFEALVRPGKKLKPGSILYEPNLGIKLKILDYTNDGRLIEYKGKQNLLEFIENYGLMPLPPYIQYSKEKEKPYQPIFAKNPGSVAAPTASLHFTPDLLKKLQKKGIIFEYTTLHIGLGTFKKVDVENISQYDIHEETAEIPADIFEKIANYKLLYKPIVAVGTTVTRTLESLPYLWKFLKEKNLLKNFPISEKTTKWWDKLTKSISNEQKIITYTNFLPNKLQFKTKLYIYPGFEYKIINQLITNFHLPKSSLLMLVAAFMGYENMKKAYQHAIKNNYKFFSFGDAMRIIK